MGIGERRTTDKAGRVKRSRTITVLVDTGERYPSGAKKYKKIVRSLGSVHSVTKAKAKEAYKKEQSKYKRKRSYFSPPLADFSRRYIEHKRYGENKKSWERDAYSLRNLNDFFGPDTRLSEIDSKRIDEYKAARQKTASPKTVNNELGCLRNLYNLAITWEEYEGENPVSRAGLIKKIIREKRKPPTPEEETLLLAELQRAAPSVAWIFKFAVNTGMRISEIINLEVDQIGETQYLEDRKVIKTKAVILDPVHTKTGEGRVIPLNADAEGVLKEALAFNKGRHKRVFLIKSRPLKPGVRRRKPKHGPLSEIRDGQPYSSRTPVYQVMNRACIKLGIRRITPHDLRRRFASRMVEGGVDLISIRDMMGHVSFKMLESYVTVNASKIRGVKAIETK